MQGYICVGGTEIRKAYAFRRAARQLGYSSNDVILNVMEYGQVDLYIKDHVDTNRLLRLGREILKENQW